MNLKETLIEFYREIIFFTLYTIIIFCMVMYVEPILMYIIVGIVIVCVIIYVIINNHQTNKEYKQGL